MPQWWKQIKERVFERGKERPTMGPEPERETLDRPPTSTAPPPPPSFVQTMLKLIPYIVFGIGLAMTIFAERIEQWALLGFLLLASSPILFALQRIERKLQELIDATKKRR